MEHPAHGVPRDVPQPGEDHAVNRVGRHAPGLALERGDLSSERDVLGDEPRAGPHHVDDGAGDETADAGCDVDHHPRRAPELTEEVAEGQERLQWRERVRGSVDERGEAVASTPGDGACVASDPRRKLVEMGKRKHKERKGSAAKAARPRGTPHDALFKHTLSDKRNALDLFRRGLPALAEAIDPRSLAVETPNFIDEELRESYTDLLFSARIGKKPVLAYLLIEHSSTVDPFLPFRLLKYVARVWDRWLGKNPGATKLPAVIPLVLHQGPRPWTGPRSLADMLNMPSDLRGELARFMPGFDMALVDLGEVAPDAFGTWNVQPSFRLSLAFLRGMNDARVDVFALLEWHQADVRATLRAPNGRKVLRRVMLYAAQCRQGLDVGELAKRAAKVAGPEAGEVVMSTAQELVEQGLKRGVTQGARNLLVRQLRVSFGRVSRDVMKRLESASAEELELWGERVLKAASIDEVFAAPRAKKKAPSVRGRRGKA